MPYPVEAFGGARILFAARWQTPRQAQKRDDEEHLHCVANCFQGNNFNQQRACVERGCGWNCNNPYCCSSTCSLVRNSNNRDNCFDECSSKCRGMEPPRCDWTFWSVKLSNSFNFFELQNFKFLAFRFFTRRFVKLCMGFGNFVNNSLNAFAHRHKLCVTPLQRFFGFIEALL